MLIWVKIHRYLNGTSTDFPGWCEGVKEKWECKAGTFSLAVLVILSSVGSWPWDNILLIDDNLYDLESEKQVDQEFLGCIDLGVCIELSSTGECWELGKVGLLFNWNPLRLSMIEKCGRGGTPKKRKIWAIRKERNIFLRSKGKSLSSNLLKTKSTH